MKRIALGAGLALAGFLLILVLRALALGEAGDASAEFTMPDHAGADRDRVATHLAEAIRIKTISWEPTDDPTVAAQRERAKEKSFGEFAAFLERTYPNSHRTLSRETINKYSLLYRWRGSDETLGPMGVIAHIDVVPVEDGTTDEWSHPPYDGIIADGSVWGRGALDTKGQLITVMEAVERLAEAGFKPARDIYLIFGHDEEVGGVDGARVIAETFKTRGIQLAFTLDEGSGVVDGIIPGLNAPIALFSVAEKGSVTLKFTARAEGGHSSAPGAVTAVSLVSSAVTAVKDNPYPLKLDSNVTEFLHAIGRHSGFGRKLILGNLWLTGSMVKSSMEDSPSMAASLRTTTAPTIIQGGAKANILPQQASAVVNYRIHPRDSVASVTKRAEQLINDERVAIEVLASREPSPQSSTTSFAYKALEEATFSIFGPIETAPSLTLQGTDSKHFPDIADNNYRFAPFVYEPADLQRIHGTDERISIDNLVRATAWYEIFIQQAAGAPKTEQ